MQNLRNFFIFVISYYLTNMSQINDDLINALKKKTPENDNTVNLLTDIIPMSKEAAYRRLRGEIPFTLEEAVTVCKSLNISLDMLIGIRHNDTYVFHLNAIFAKEPIHEYCKMLTSISKGVQYVINKDAKAVSYRAYRSLPLEYVYKYKSLSKAYIYVLFYQLHLELTPKELANRIIPDEIFSMQQELSQVMHDIDSLMILDKHIFQDYIEIIQYFQGLGTIPAEEISQIKNDLLLMIDDLEYCATTGTTLHNKKLDIYISNISFDCNYTYLRGADYESCSVGVYCLDHISCLKPSVSKIHEVWIKSLTRFSTLISVSGESVRNEFFYKQRNYVNTML